MSEYRETILKLDRDESYQELYDFVRTQPAQLDQLVVAAVAMLRARRVQGAYLIAKMLEHQAFNPILAFAQAVGGYARGSREDEDKGCKVLETLIDRLTPIEQLRFYLEFEPITRTMVGHAFAGPERGDKVGRLTALIKAFTPAFRALMDESAEVVPVDAQLARWRGKVASRLVTLNAPSAPARNRRVLIALRARVFPQDPHSRTFEVGPLLQAACMSYGWHAELFGMEWFTKMTEDFSRLEAAAQQFRPDVLIVDEQVVQVPEGRQGRTALIAKLRTALPGLKVVGLHLDPWSVVSDQLVAAAADVDLVWTFAPDLPAWRDKAFARKLLTAPLPYPVLDHSSIVDARSLGFHGSIASYNWHRWIWLAAADRVGINIQTGLTAHKADNLVPEESFRNYLTTLSDYGSVINFGMRSDLSLALTGRTFEVLAAGALLVQEATPELDHFLIAGEHYLPFKTLSDLRAIADFVAGSPSEARAIADRGHAFFIARYAPQRIIGYMDHALSMTAS